MTPDSATCRIKTNFRERSGFCHSDTLKRIDAGRYGNVVLVDDKLDILKVVRHGEVIG